MGNWWEMREKLSPFFNKFMHGFIINEKKIALSQKSHSVDPVLYNLLVNRQAGLEAVV